MLNLTIALEGFLMIVLALGLGLYLHQRMGMPWRLYVVGALTFIASQVVHIPLLIGLTALFAQGLLPQPPVEWLLTFNAVVLGLAAGLCEEVARWLVYRFVLRDARTWQEALMFGAGHGGIEAIVTGLSVLGVFVAFGVMGQAQIDALPAATQSQAEAVHSAPDLVPLVGVLERVSALCIHLGMAVLVLQVFVRGSMLYLFAAILYHSLVDGLTVYLSSAWGIAATETGVALMALIALGIVYAYRPRVGMPRLAVPS